MAGLWVRGCTGRPAVDWFGSTTLVVIVIVIGIVIWTKKSSSVLIASTQKKLVLLIMILEGTRSVSSGQKYGRPPLDRVSVTMQIATVGKKQPILYRGRLCPSGLSVRARFEPQAAPARERGLKYLQYAGSTQSHAHILIAIISSFRLNFFRV